MWFIWALPANVILYMCLLLDGGKIQGESSREFHMDPAVPRGGGLGFCGGVWVLPTGWGRCWNRLIQSWQGCSYCGDPPLSRFRSILTTGDKREKEIIYLETTFVQQSDHCAAASPWCPQAFFLALKKVPEYLPWPKRPQYKWILHCFLTFSFIRQWNTNTKNPGTKEQRQQTHLNCMMLLHYHLDMILALFFDLSALFRNLGLSDSFIEA